MVGSTFWKKHDYNTFSKKSWLRCILVKTWLQHIPDNYDLQHILKKKIMTAAHCGKTWLTAPTWKKKTLLPCILGKHDWDTLWNTRYMISTYSIRKWLQHILEKSMIGSTYWKKHDYNAFWKNDWLHILQKKHDCNAFWKKKWLQHILENTWLKNILEKKTRLQCIQEKHDYSTFWKKYDYNVTWKKLLAAHSGKTCFLTHSVKKHDC